MGQKTQTTLGREDRVVVAGKQVPQNDRAPAHEDISRLLSQMTFSERVRAYRTGAFSRRELTQAAAREPDRMPLLNGEFEHIAMGLADLE